MMWRVEIETSVAMSAVLAPSESLLRVFMALLVLCFLAWRDPRGELSSSPWLCWLTQASSGSAQQCRRCQHSFPPELHVACRALTWCCFCAATEPCTLPRRSVGAGSSTLTRSLLAQMMPLTHQLPQQPVSPFASGGSLEVTAGGGTGFNPSGGNPSVSAAPAATAATEPSQEQPARSGMLF